MTAQLLVAVVKTPQRMGDLSYKNLEVAGVPNPAHLPGLGNIVDLEL